MPNGTDSGALDALVVNGWTLFGHPIFYDDLLSLMAEVESMADQDGHGTAHSAHWKVLDCVMGCILERIPSNPDHADFRLGHTLGKNMTHWRRAKQGMPNRYRLFFQFRSTAPNSIIYAWFNNETTLRKEGAKTDCYTVFQHLVQSGCIPNSYTQLLAACERLPKDLSRP